MVNRVAVMPNNLHITCSNSIQAQRVSSHPTACVWCEHMTEHGSLSYGVCRIWVQLPQLGTRARCSTHETWTTAVLVLIGLMSLQGFYAN